MARQNTRTTGDTETPDANAAQNEDANPSTENDTVVSPTNPVLDLALLATDAVAEFTSATIHVPQEVKDFIKRAHDHWKAHPKKWRKVELGSEAAVKETVKLARLAATEAGLTFRRKSIESKTELVYKVTDPPTTPAPAATDTPQGSGNGE